MAIKNISDLSKVTSLKDSDLFVVETNAGTKAIKSSNMPGKIRKVSITLLASSWNSNNNAFTQAITLSETTVNSKVDLQPDNTTLNQMLTDGTYALYIENNNSTFTAYAIGYAPTVDLTIQATITELG